MKNRLKLLDLVKKNGCNTAVEIGCYSGKFSLEILLHTEAETLYCVDAFDYRNMSEANKHNGAYKEFYNRLNPYIVKDRVVVMKNESLKAASNFNDLFFDFIYLDASHTLDDVKQDLIAWFPKLKLGGIFAGHDYKNIGKIKRVRQAVNEFFDDKKYEIRTTNEAVSSFWVKT